MMNYLVSEPCFQVVGSAFSGQEAIDMIRVVRPELLLVDYRMPTMNGFDLIKELQALPKPPKVIILSMDDQPAYREAAISAGADGFIIKSNLFDSLIPLVNSLFANAKGGGR
jgi:DNA-binding NarL/FixJ family response regulator